MRSAVAICALMASWFPYVKTISGGANLRTPNCRAKLVFTMYAGGVGTDFKLGQYLRSADSTKSKGDPLASPATSRENPIQVVGSAEKDAQNLKAPHLDQEMRGTK